MKRNIKGELMKFLLSRRDVVLAVVQAEDPGVYEMFF